MVVINKKDLLKLIKQYNIKFRLQQYYFDKDRQTKEQILKQITRLNYKVVRNEPNKRWELHPLKDPKRMPKIIGLKDPPKPKKVVIKNKIPTHLKKIKV